MILIVLGQWVYKQKKKFSSRRWLGNFNYNEGKMELKSNRSQEDYSVTHNKASNEDLITYMTEAHQIVKEIASRFQRKDADVDHQALFDSTTLPLKWFLMPSEVIGYLRKKEVTVAPSPFVPQRITIRSTEIDTPIVPSTNPVDSNELVEPKEQTKRAERRRLFPNLPKREILTPTKKAILEYSMIQDGDRILVGVSGVWRYRIILTRFRVRIL
jgi:hypothetical protein